MCVLFRAEFMAAFQTKTEWGPQMLCMVDPPEGSFLYGSPCHWCHSTQGLHVKFWETVSCFRLKFKINIMHLLIFNLGKACIDSLTKKPICVSLGKGGRSMGSRRLGSHITHLPPSSLWGALLLFQSPVLTWCLQFFFGGVLLGYWFLGVHFLVPLNPWWGCAGRKADPFLGHVLHSRAPHGTHLPNKCLPESHSVLHLHALVCLPWKHLFTKSLSHQTLSQGLLLRKWI